MSLSQAEGAIQTIIRDIVQECTVRGHTVSSSLVAFTVKAVLLDPKNGFDVDSTLTKHDVQKLEEICVDKLTEKCSPSLETIKMQVYFDMNYTSRREFLEEIQRVAEAKLYPLSRQITDSRVKTREELDNLYRSVVTYIVQRSGMGQPTHDHTVREAAAALQSVFPPTELGSFMALPKRDKEQQLSELTMIVTGIRLFNKACKKAADQSNLHELMPDALNEALGVISKRLEKELSASQSLAWKYTAVLEKLTESDQLPTAALCKQALYNVRQHEVFLKILLADAHLCTGHVELLQKELLSQIKLLKETVQSKTAVPTAKVFPPFKALSKLWYGLQDEAELLNIHGNVSLNLQPFLASQAQIFSEPNLEALLEASRVKTDEERATESSDERIVPAEMKGQDWILPETDHFCDPMLQYSGFCGYTLVSRDGLLLPGNPRIGVLKHKEKLFAFSSKEAALKFAASPDHFIAEVAERAKLSPELIQLLKLQQHFSSVSPYSELQAGESLLAKTCESGTQTDLHPVETNIVRSYEWNEWELRRKALKLADLRSKVTHSAQTHLSHMRRENVTQTWPPKDAGSQTKRDGESGMPKPHIYLAGLRGRRDGRVVKTDLTRSMHDQ